MNEIERAIEFMFGQQALAEQAYLKNTDERVIARIDKVVAYYDLAIKELRAELSRQENAPLTWDEVVASEGKPVFIYGLEGEHGDDGWSIVGEKYERSGFTFVNLHDKNITNCGLDDLYGKTWIAYRYEPKGERD